MLQYLNYMITIFGSNYRTNSINFLRKSSIFKRFHCLSFSHHTQVSTTIFTGAIGILPSDFRKIGAIHYLFTQIFYLYLFLCFNFIIIAFSKGNQNMTDMNTFRNNEFIFIFIVKFTDLFLCRFCFISRFLLHQFVYFNTQSNMFFGNFIFLHKCFQFLIRWKSSFNLFHRHFNFFISRCNFSFFYFLGQKIAHDKFINHLLFYTCLRFFDFISRNLIFKSFEFFFYIFFQLPISSKHSHLHSRQYRRIEVV